jgi:hypothetical protein
MKRAIVVFLLFASTLHAQQAVIAGGSGGGGGGGGTPTDTSYRLFPTATSAPNLGGGAGFISPGWQTDTTLVQQSGSPANDLNGIYLPKATGAHYAFLFVQVPVGWNNTIGLISTYFLHFNSSGTGTGVHDYALSCFIPGTTNISTAITWTTAVTVSFNVTNCPGWQYRHSGAHSAHFAAQAQLDRQQGQC